MGKISNQLIKEAYKIARDFHRKKITLKEAKDILATKGMNKNSATDYIYNYSNLIQGKLFTRTASAFATEHYLKNIYEEHGQTGLKNALVSLSQHLDYYEEKTGVKIKKRREIYNKYLQ